MNKFDRVVSILMLLQTKRIIRAQDLSDKFEVSLRTIYRDLRTLEHAGVPIHAEAGVGYSLVDGYNLPPVMFTADEATSFLVAEKLLEKMTDDKTSVHFSEAVLKIKAVLKTTEKENMNNLEKHIQVSPGYDTPDASNETRMPEIFRSINNRIVLNITYMAIYNGQRTNRNIEPLGVHFYSNHWHLIAYCLLRKEYRDFRLDRIECIKETTAAFQNEHPSLTDYLNRMAEEQDLITVKLRFDKEVAGYTRTEKFYYGFVEEIETENFIEMTFLSASLNSFSHWLLVYVDRVTIVEPKALADIMRGLTKRLVGHYK